MPEPLPFPDFCAQAKRVAELLKLMGNPQRVVIVCLLAEGEAAVSEIEDRTGIRQPSLSQHLGALREGGVVEGRRSAKAVIYRLVDSQAIALMDALKAIFTTGDPLKPYPKLEVTLPTVHARGHGVAAFARLQPDEATP